MKYILTTTFVLAFLLIGCSPQEADEAGVMAPQSTPAIQTINFDLEVNGTLYPVTINYSTVRTAQTTMNATLLRDYFAIEIVKNSYIPPMYWCYLYRDAGVYQGGVFLGNIGLRGAFDLLPDSQIYGTVFLWEYLYGGHIPDEIPPEAYPCYNP